MVAFSGGDAAAHALLAECLHALREDGEAVTEYEKALATRPDDPSYTHGLSAARHALATDARREHSSRAHHSATQATTSAPASVEGMPPAPSEGAPPPPDQPPAEAPERDDKADDKGASEKAAPSAPAEPAPDQQH